MTTPPHPFRLADLLSAGHALFLDFDGTLVDLAEQPDAVRVPDGLLATLSAVDERLGGAMAVVSGRSIAAIDDFLGPTRWAVAGVHGSERRRADGTLVCMAPPSLAHVQEAAAALAAEHPALVVEHKRGALALHYRQAPDLEAICRQAMLNAVADSPGVSLLGGKMVFEAKSAEANKGLAIEAFLQEPPFKGRTPVFVGDDTTDEPGFSVVQKHGGHGIKVGSGPTLAHHRIQGPGTLREALATWLAEIDVPIPPAPAVAARSPSPSPGNPG